MATITWPAGLPDFNKSLLDEFKEKPGTTAIRTEMEAGPDKMRRRGTAVVDEIDVGFVLSASQVTTLDDFYIFGTKMGSLRFDIIHPRTGNTVKARFLKRPEYEKKALDVWRVEFTIEVLP